MPLRKQLPSSSGGKGSAKGTGTTKWGAGSTPFTARLTTRKQPRPNSPGSAAFNLANANFPYPGVSSIYGNVR